ncbi:MAG: class I SAM-dependent DNA methyltransferase [Saprospiraceae bacterium]|nr:class I SAM-dependent DNA methyltransferase [Saprospiraceae bacterium]
MLKNAYYKESSSYTELETLPNIDINIKCGNSLISRFGLDADLGKSLKSIKYTIDDYRAFVYQYKNCKDREEKRGLEEIINSIKNNFQTKIGMNDPKKKKLDQLMSELYHRFTGNFLFEPEEPYGGKKDPKTIEKEKLEAEIEKLSMELEDVKNNEVYRNAFEWRFEFPEVLNDHGDFVGFDVVVGNPPYIRHEEIKIIKPQLEKVFKVYNSTADILTYFFELGHGILCKNGILSFIVSNKFFKVSFGNHVRSFLMKNTSVEK